MVLNDVFVLGLLAKRFYIVLVFFRVFFLLSLSTFLARFEFN